MYSSHTGSRGFIALISVLMLSVILLATTLSLAQFGLANRYFLLELENKSKSEKLAEACIHIARIAIYNNPLYTIDTPLEIPVGKEVCTLASVTPGDGESTIHAQAIIHTATTNVTVVVDSDDGEFLSWEETPTL